MMNLDEIRQILDMVREHELAEFELEQDGVKLRLRKGGVVVATAPALAMPAVAAAPAATVAAPVAAPANPAAAEDGLELAVVTAPIVGTFYRSAVARCALVRRGRHARQAGPDVLCIIEAMKLMNEIEAEHDGEVVNDLRGERAAGAVRRAPVRVQAFLSRHVQEDPDRQSRRDRPARHLRVPRTRHQDGRRVLARPTSNSAARAVRRRGRLHRPGPVDAESYLNVPAIISAAEITGCRCHPSRVRLPV
jgi:acetyl-CoA carboxylase biotin carboxyl carrier protein